MSAKATYFEITGISNVADSPRVKINAELIVDVKGEVQDIDSVNIRSQIENACDVFVTVRSRDKK